MWNTLPLPEIGAELREEVIDAGRGVIGAREHYPDKSLAALYEPSSMPSEVVVAHEALDRVVDGVFGLAGAQRIEEGRQRALFKEYALLSAGLLAGSVKAGRKR